MAEANVLTPVIGYAIARATMMAALAADSMVGRGDEQAADAAAARAMVKALNTTNMTARIVVGDGDAAEMLDVGNTLGTGAGPEVDLALDALEGATLTAKAQLNAITVVAATTRGGLFQAPDIYMEKIAIGPGHASGVIDLDAPAGENALRLAASRGVDVRNITACVLDRPRHDKIIADLRRVGARVNLIGDGDVAGIISTSLHNSGIDMYVGQGGALQGVLAAAALRCAGGQMQTRLVFRSESDKMLARKAGVTDFNRRYQLDDLVSGETIFAATGVTSGQLLDGVTRYGGAVHTHSLVMSSVDGVVRRMRSALPIREEPPAAAG